MQFLDIGEQWTVALKNKVSNIKNYVKHYLTVQLEKIQENEEYNKEEDCPICARPKVLKTARALLEECCFNEDGDVLNELQRSRQVVEGEEANDDIEEDLEEIDLSLDGDLNWVDDSAGIAEGEEQEDVSAKEMKEKRKTYPKLNSVELVAEDPNVMLLQGIVSNMRQLVEDTGGAFPIQIKNNLDTYQQYVPFLYSMLAKLEERKEELHCRYNQGHVSKAPEGGGSAPATGGASHCGVEDGKKKRKRRPKRAPRSWDQRGQGRKCKTHHVLIETQVRPHHSWFTNSSFEQLLKMMAKDKSSTQIAREFADEVLKLPQRQRWKEIFDLDVIVSGYSRIDYVERVFSGNANIFGESFRSDGVDIIFHIRRRKTFEKQRLEKLRAYIKIQDRLLENRIYAAKKNDLSTHLHDRRLVQGERALLKKGNIEIARMKKYFAKDRYSTVIGIDPGQKNPVTAVKYTKLAEDHLRRGPADTGACAHPFDPGGSNDIKKRAPCVHNPKR